MYSRLLLRQFKHTLRRSPCSRAYHQYLTYSPKVKEALANNEPVVALESTIISHGMPYPMNVETARAVEKIVENGGCVPATVALMDGKIHVGLTDEVLERLGKHGSSVVKASRRDLAMVLSQGLMGATTVSTTMMAAHRAGIRIFVTGGIGGVHRGAETTYDISADLTELGRTPITVVCAGAKSILDLPKTLEFLETQGVPVVTFGDSDDFPAFFTPKSGLKAKTNLDLDTKNGIVVAVPIPEESAADSKGINKAIKVAIQESMYAPAMITACSD
ncbi:hypothetical protein EV182_002921 [Spiromyces aspiralis]|uniref:Uncharacterized protein n=1 Tax=Spiromyces aspiralis TaxID=68401 RepID=A0ACC1HR52_9FUNG|nr:hypothetical protein EV182_002921 [Spiromyces aspiralis]